MVFKKAAVKKANGVKAEVKSKVMEFKKAVKVEAKSIEKQIESKVGTRWETSSTEEKVYTIIGILLLIVALYMLRQIVGGMLLIVIGILCVTGFFMKKGKK